MNADPRPTSSRRQPSDATEREAFKRKVLTLDRGECCVHEYLTDCEGPREAHHVVTQQQLRHAGRHDLLWDPRNGMTVCELAHRLHTRAVKRIHLGAIPLRCLDFADRHGFDAVIGRHYSPAP